MIQGSIAGITNNQRVQLLLIGFYFNAFLEGAAVGEVGKESKLLSMTLKYSLSLLVFVCIWTGILSIVL